MKRGFTKVAQHSWEGLLWVSLLLEVHLHAAFTIPPGFTVPKVASEPEVRFPMFATFDDKGRLFVTESSGGDLYKEISAQTRLCNVRLLEDVDGDGKFERSTVFADKINFPMGLAWRDGKLYLADPPDLVTLVDTNNDGRADVRTVLVTGFGHKDNGSLHWLTFGPDGWLYMTCGEPDGYKIKRPDGTLLEGYNGALLRCRPDGSSIEVLCRGFVNLVEVVFTPAGEIIGTDNWFRWPSGGVRDALVHLVPGGLYPLHLKDVGTQHPVLSDPLPPVSLFPAVALSGLMRYEGRNFPGEMHGNLFAAEHNSRKVSRHVLSREGSTFKAEPNDFLSTDDPDFHPSDVLEAPDGSLLVLDTGSWYTDHCPTGRIRKSPATGGIYRVRFNGQSTAKAGREREFDQVWGHAPSHDDAASTKLRSLLANENGTVAAAAARLLALRHDRAAEHSLIKLLTSPKAELRLAAAEALAHCGTSNSLPAIWSAFDDSPDHFLEHALSYAAHHIADAEVLRAVLDHPNPRVRRTALLLLNQPPRPREALTADTIRPHLISPDESLRRTALQVLQNRPELVDAARKFLRELAEFRSPSDQLRAAFSDLALAFKTDPHVQTTLGLAMRHSALEVRITALDVCARSALPKLPEPWIDPLRTALSDPPVRAEALRAVAALNVSTFDDALNRIADDATEPPPIRVQSIGNLTVRAPRLSEERFRFLLQQLRDSPLAALAAADVMRRARLDDVQLNAALKALPPQSPVVPGSLLGTLRECSSSASAAKLLDTISKFAAGVAGEDLALLEGKLPAELRPRVKELQKLSEKSRVANHAELDKFMSLLEYGDAGRGRAVFFDAKIACATCHAIGSEGGKVGPDLTKVGAIRSGRDILESVVLPSSTFAQTYEPYAVLTKDGRELTGTIARQESDSILLRDATGSELHLPRNLIRELRRQEISIMPEGLEGGLSEREFRDLLAFLQSLK